MGCSPGHAGQVPNVVVGDGLNRNLTVAFVDANLSPFLDAELAAQVGGNDEPAFRGYDCSIQKTPVGTHSEAMESNFHKIKSREQMF